MTDKYEEFKDWTMERTTSSTKFEILHNLFREFEEEQAEKEKEREIKRTIKQALKELRYSGYSTEGYAHMIYKVLKEKDLIK